jgi:hypothetical protein
MLRQSEICVCMLVISVFAFLNLSNLQAAAVDETLAKINRLGPAER